eukprot:1026368-Pelagomonas_calceolata.AAC.3
MDSMCRDVWRNTFLGLQLSPSGKMTSDLGEMWDLKQLSLRLMVNATVTPLWCAFTRDLQNIVIHTCGTSASQAHAALPRHVHSNAKQHMSTKCATA